MAAEKTNRTLSIPLSPSDAESYYVISQSHFEKERIKIYWGPNQNTERDYFPPLESDWNNNFSPIAIPRMGRFHYFNSELDSDKYKPSVPPSPPPPPTPGKWELIDATPLYGYGPDNPCKAYYVSWQFNDPSNPSFKPITRYTCYTMTGPSSCACHPHCQCRNPGQTGSDVCPGSVVVDFWGRCYICNDRQCG